MILTLTISIALPLIVAAVIREATEIHYTNLQNRANANGDF